MYMYTSTIFTAFVRRLNWLYHVLPARRRKRCYDLPGPGLSITNTDIANKTCAEMATNYPRICAPDFWGGNGNTCCDSCQDVDGKRHDEAMRWEVWVNSENDLFSALFQRNFHYGAVTCDLSPSRVIAINDLQSTPITFRHHLWHAIVIYDMSQDLWPVIVPCHLSSSPVTSHCHM